MQVPAKVKELVFPARGDLRRLHFRERDWLTALVPDDECFSLARELILQRVYEPAGGFPAGGTVIDAGAHVGLFSLLASQHAAKVIALEPDPVNYRVLDLNCRLNGTSNVHPVNAALWTEEGEVSFHTSWHTTGGSVGSGGDLRVRTRTLDGLLEEHGRVDLLKLDVEGAEFDVLHHAGGLEDVGRIVAELHLREPGEERPLLDDLRDRGFSVELVPASSLYGPRWVRPVVRNRKALRGERRLKLALLAYLLAPIQKPRRPAGGRDMPLVVAWR